MESFLEDLAISLVVGFVIDKIELLVQKLLLAFQDSYGRKY